MSAAAFLLAFLPPAAEARSCDDPAAVTSVLRLLRERLGLNGALSLDHIQRIPSDAVTGGPICEARIDGIRDGPTIFGRALDVVRYWDERPAGQSGEPAVGARLVPRGESASPPALVEASPAGR